MGDVAGANYNLGSDTLKLVRDAGLGGEAQRHLNNAGIAQGLNDAATIVKDKVVERREGFDAAEAKWDEGFDAIDDRGSWASGELFDQFQVAEEGYKNEYIEAVRRGDKKAQKRMMKDQATRASGLAGWKETMTTGKGINDMEGGGWSKRFEHPDNWVEQEIIKATTTLDGKTAVSRTGPQGEMVFDITLSDGNVVTKTRRQVDEIMAKGTKPLKLKEETMQGMLDLKKNAMENGGEDWDRGIAYQKIYDRIDENNISSYMHENIVGNRTFIEDFVSDENPVWKEPISINSPELLALENNTPGTNPDGIIDEEEWSLILDGEGKEEVRALMAKELENQPDIAKEHLSEWIVNLQENNVNAGAKEYEKNNRTKPVKTVRTTLTKEEKNKNREIADTNKIMKDRRSPIVINGKDFGLVHQYKKDPVTGTWYNKNAKGPDGNPMSIEDMQLDVQDELIFAIESLQMPVVSDEFNYG